MANKKYKLTDGNMWATDGIHDFGQNKTQRTINSEVNSALGGKAPTNHASTATTYGAASTSNYGHVKLSNTTPSMDGTAAVGDSTDVARANHVHPSDTSRVPTSRKVNNKQLSSDITLSAADVSAVPTSRKVNDKQLSADITLSASDVGAAPTSHASTATTYGKGTSSNYGHVKISDSLTDTTTAATGGVVPSMKAVSDLNGAINDEIAERKTYTKPNLLDNWYFLGGGSQAGAGKFPINQRGLTTYTSGWTIDRWVFINNATIELTSAGLVWKPSGASNRYFGQRLEDMSAFQGKTISVSVFVAANTFTNACYYGFGGAVDTIPAGQTGLFTHTETLDVGSSPTQNCFFFRSPPSVAESGTLTIVAVKMELGDTQTLAHQVNGVWVLNEKPNYQEELVKCIGSHAESGDTYANNDYANVPRIYHKSGLMPTEIGTAAQVVYAASTLGITVPSGKSFVLLYAEALNANANAYYNLPTAIGTGDVYGGVLTNSQPNVVFRIASNNALTAYGGQPVNFVVAVL